MQYAPYDARVHSYFFIHNSLCFISYYEYFM